MDITLTARDSAPAVEDPGPESMTIALQGGDDEPTVFVTGTAYEVEAFLTECLREVRQLMREQERELAKSKIMAMRHLQG